MNGYVFPTTEGIEHVNRKLAEFDSEQKDRLRGKRRIGVQSNTPVTLRNHTHLVTQAYCSAVPVSYSDLASNLWSPLAKIILEAAYEATLLVSAVNAAQTGNNRCFLTLLGGGAFGNRTDWIIDAIERAIRKLDQCGLNIAIVSHRQSNPHVQDLVQRLTSSAR